MRIRARNLKHFQDNFTRFRGSIFYQTIIKIQNHEDTVKYPESKYKDAFFAAMEEYNQYGIAEVSSRYRLDKTAMDELYGFKVAWCYEKLDQVTCVTKQTFQSLFCNHPPNKQKKGAETLESEPELMSSGPCPI